MKTSKGKCVIIGEDNLTLSCANYLFKRGFIITAVCSNNIRLIEWAKHKNIFVYETYLEFQNAYELIDCDYLFSVLNSRILPLRVISKARIMAVNFHNSLLPKYAGSHATSWSIIAGETQQGVTWHKITEEIDAGEIIKQNSIPISETDTALSLNIKCTELGLKLFKNMIADFEQSKFAFEKQNKGQRTYFTKSAKPVGNAVIDFNNTAEEISRLFRACYYEHFRNDFACPKIVLDTKLDYILAKKLDISATQSSKLPGTVLGFDNGKLCVSTQSYNVYIHDFYDEYGNNLSETEIKNNYQIVSNLTNIPRLPAVINDLQVASEAFASHEKRWEKEFIVAKNPVFPNYTPNSNNKKTSYRFITEFNLNLADIKQHNKILQVPDSTIAFVLILIYIQRVNNYENYYVGVSKRNALINPSIEKFFFNFSWVNCNFYPEKKFIDLLIYFSHEMKNEKYDSNCLKDVLFRFNELKNRHILPKIIVVFGEQDFQAINSMLIIKIVNSHVSVYYSEYEGHFEADQLYLLESMGEKINTMLTKLQEDIECPVYKLPLLDYSGMSLYFHSWANSKKSYSVGKRMLDFFENSVKQHPNNIAVVFRDTSITYQQLNSFANELALKLVEDKIYPGDSVGIISVAGIETIISMVAILKVGAAYVPIDPSYPHSYLSNIVNDSRLKLILANLSSAHDFCQFLQEKHPAILLYSYCFSELSGVTTNVRPVTNNDLRYIIYTSGTTGAPKGVKIGEQGIIRLVIDNNYLEIKSEYKISQISNISFDASTFEIWGALLNGATLVCIEQEIILHPVKFKEELNKNKIDVLWITSSLLDNLVTNDPSIFSNLKYLLTGGDVVNPNTVKKVLDSDDCKIRKVINGYGPTENTTFTTTFSILPNTQIPSEIPIGKPITNTQVYVVDKYLQLVCVGMPGDLLISGEGLAFDYNTQQDSDDDVFIETSEISGKLQRYYKSGDCVKWLIDGNLAFLGRKDNLLKIRGFRVEVGYIKKALMKNPKISQCYISIINRSQFYVYVTSRRGETVTEEELLEYLKNNLPYYMVPSKIIIMKKFPLNRNGKLDDEMLKSVLNSKNYKVLRKPGNATENILLEIWRSILNIKDISVDDNFFHIGGNSLLVSTLIYKVYTYFDYRLEVSDFLSEPTIQSLARLVLGEPVEIGTQFILAQDVNIKLNIDNNLKLLSRTNMATSSSVLVTGATGFLGAHLVRELILAGVREIFCIVRAESDEKAKNKLLASLKKWDLPTTSLKNTIVLKGDLAKEKLGLTKENYARIINVHEIYHAAAEVNHVYSYEQLRGSNFVGTLNLLKLLQHNTSIHFNYISTISACFDHRDSSGFILETMISDKTLPKNINDGYSLTKWASEILLSQLFHKGCNIKIFRPAWITSPVSDKNYVIPNNHLYMLMKGCIQLGFVPAWNTRINITPVDQLAKIIVLSSDKSADKNNVYNIVNPHSFAWLEYISQACESKYNMTVISPENWYKMIEKIDNTNALFPLTPIYTSKVHQSWLLKQNCISDAHNENYISLLNASGGSNLVTNDIVSHHFGFENILQA